MARPKRTPVQNSREVVLSKQKKTSRKKSGKTAAKKQPPQKSAVRGIKTSDSGANKPQRFPVVGIGASAGGLEALEGFFSNTPSDIQTGFVVIQHLAPEHKSIMGSLLEKHTKLKVEEIRDGIKIKPGCVYLNTPNKDVSIINGRLSLSEPVQPRGVRLPIDYFFRSLAEDQGDKSICIILSGTGTDGTLGLKAVKGAGGMVMVQEEKQARYDNMPRNAIETGLVDFILPVEKMASELLKYIQHPYIEGSEKVPTAKEQFASHLNKIFLLVRSTTGHDFSQYKPNTIRRRIERRMAVHQLEHISEYVRYLQKNVAETKTLFRDLLITVTNFFRDPKAFKILNEKVILPMAKDKSNDANIRVWIPGCATGEEAYSVAILFSEAMKKLKKHFNVQIFATDIDAAAIEYARLGGYPDSIAADVSTERLRNFFIKEENAFRVKKQLRQLVVFAAQNLIKDAPFSKLDLVCCRNVLIYLNASLQKKILPLFHYTLNPDGVMFLGTSETIGEFADLFTPVDTKWKIFRRKPAGSEAGFEHPSLPLNALTQEAAKDVKKYEPTPVNIRQLAEQTILREYAPPCVLVDSGFDVHFFHGDTDEYLSMPTGEPTFNLLRISREELRFKLSTALHKCLKEKKTVKCKDLKMTHNGTIVQVNVVVRPVVNPTVKGEFMMVLFEPSKTPAKSESKGKNKPSDKPAEPRVAALEQELQSTKEYLRTTIEELETSNEELKSANEELQSTNEELQSTNEELETSREELQSTNEELETVNAELQNKVEQLSEAYNDLNNLLGCTEIATIFLDNDINVKRFTPTAASVFKLIKSDIGRPISDIVHNLKYDSLDEDVRQVLNHLGRVEKEIQAKNNYWFQMRILPYRTIDNTIDGVVVTFINISKQKEAEQEVREIKEKYSH